MRAATNAIICALIGLGWQSSLAAEAIREEGSLKVVPATPSGGNAEALVRLGDLYFTGELLRQDLSTAVLYYRRAADEGSPTGKVRLGEMLARGQGVAQDIDLGRAMVREVAEAGNARAFVALGDLYSRGDGGPIDAEAAIGAYEAAASLGDSEALIRLGDVHYEGSVGRVDLRSAFGSFRRAAEANNPIGKRRVGEMLARGQGVEQDVERGRAIVSDVAERGNAHAFLALGDLYIRGDGGPIDSAAGIVAYEKAAALGNTQALIKLGDIYRNGTVVRANRRKAVDYYRRAADAGNPYGLYALGKGYVEGQFRGLGPPALGIKILWEAERAGVEEAIVALSDGYLEGRGVRRNSGEGLALLRRAMDEGNLLAGLQLVRLYRDGHKIRNVTVVPKNETRARSYLHAIEGRLGPNRLASEQLLLDFSASPRKADYEESYGQLQNIPPQIRPSLLRQLRTVEPNAYVFFLQQKLKFLGLYTGGVAGRLNAATVRAFNDYCATINARSICRHGPLSGQAADVLSFAF
jgi:uncharacterized protein